jgi:UDP-N-acetyl-D-galactosamine dehydrogenase
MLKVNKKIRLGVMGLGYVGLPLALEFAKKRPVIAFDTSKLRIRELNAGLDKNLEFKKQELTKSKKIIFTNKIKDLKNINCYIIAVPTPINKFKKPNLSPLLKASKIASSLLNKGDIVIYESTVYPGCIEEECVPILEKFSGLYFNKDFFCGYSPERINPGDKEHTIANIKKITSGSTPKITDFVDNLYQEIITAGTHKVSNIRVAEAAKVIENTQRDINIAFINELFILFNKMKIDTKAVLDAAESKWNFLPFKPGLVGGHCIGVDPYYLTHKAKSIGYKPKIILAGREINDKMSLYIPLEFLKKMRKKKICVKGSRVLIMGLTFKENCTDLRNSGIEKVIRKLKKFGCKLDLYDPWANKNEIKKIYNTYPKSKLIKNTYDGIIVSVAHKKFRNMGLKFVTNLCKKNHVIYDLKYLFYKNQAGLRL